MRSVLALAAFVVLAATLPATAQPARKGDPTPTVLGRSVATSVGPARLGADGPLWDDRFGLPSFTLYAASAAVAPNGDLYVGGYISSVGGLDARGIARWDGRRWHTLGDGVDGTVTAIAVAANGDVFVGGDFVNAGPVRANGIAKWSPATGTWAPLGGTLDGTSRGTVRALTAAPDGSVYAGGDFTSIGGVTAGNVARYANGAWQALGTGVGYQYGTTFDPAGGSVYAIAVDGDAVTVGGRFTGAEGLASGSVIRWNAGAGAWTALGGVADAYGSLGTVNALAVSGGVVFAAGTFTTAGGVPAANVARYGDGAWTALGQGLEGTYGTSVLGLALADGRLVATGDFDAAGGFAVRKLAQWDGTDWSGVGGGLGYLGRAVVAAPDGLVVLGDFDLVGTGTRAESVARWTGAEWRAYGLGIGYASIEGTVNAMAWMGDVLVVGGGFDYAGGRPVSNVAAWDGVDWRALGAGVDSGIEALAVGADGAVYAGGSFTTAGGVSANHIARWDGTGWTPLGSGINGTVYSLALGPDGALYAGGEFTAAGTVTARNIARWNGAAWSTLGDGTDGRVEAIAVTGDGIVFAGGDLDVTGGQDTNGIAAWNGAAWVPLGLGVQQVGTYGDYAGTVEALALADGYLYVGGDFVKAGTTAAAGVARFDGTTWTALGTGLGGGDQEVFALFADGADVYVGGNFQTAGGLASPNLARWSSGADAWSDVDGGIVLDDSYGSVRTLADFRGALFAGGRYFNTADGQPVAAIARWGTDDETPPVGAQIAVDPAALDFGTTAPGTTRTLTVTVRNPGDAPLTATVGTPTDAAFAVTGGGGAFTLAPGTTRTVTVTFAPAAPGTADATLAITHNATATGTPVIVSLQGRGETGGGVTVVRAFDPDGSQLLWTVGDGTADGFVFGTNVYRDRAKGVVLAAPAGLATGSAVSEVRVWFATVTPTPGGRTYDVAIYAGDETSGPLGPPLGSQTFALADVQADADPGTPSVATVHRFTQPIPVDGSFVVVVDFGTYDSNALLAIDAGDRVGARVPGVWEELSGGTWINLSDSWTGGGVAGAGTDGWQLWIEADVTAAGGTATGDEPAWATGIEAIRPNPFRTEAAVGYGLAEAGPVSLRVFDVLGREVAVLADGPMAAGHYEARFDGAGLASGTYVVRLDAGGTVQTRRITLAR